MKVAVSCLGSTMDAYLDARFGRASCFMIVDTDTLSFSAIDNAAQSAVGGAGIAAAQLVIANGAEAIITGQIGPNARDVLNASDIPIYEGLNATVSDNITAFNRGKLPVLADRGQAGMGYHRAQP